MSRRAMGVTVRRGTLNLLDDGSLEALPGELLAVVGPSGAGKSTSPGVLGGLLAADRGSVTLDGPGSGRGPSYSPTEWSACRRRRRTWKSRCRPPATAGSGCGPRRPSHRAGRADPPYGQPRRGTLRREQQRVALARALAVGPEVLLADEPTAEPDAEAPAACWPFRDLASAGAIVVLATHEEIAGACAARVVARGGRLCG